MIYFLTVLIYLNSARSLTSISEMRKRFFGVSVAPQALRKAEICRQHGNDRPNHNRVRAVLWI
jgi:hypothetical protein